MDVNDNFMGMFAIFAIFIMPFLVIGSIIIYAIRSSTKKREYYLNKGIMPVSNSYNPPNKLRMLRNGFLCIGIGAGVVVGLKICDGTDWTDITSFLVLTASVSIGMGISYIVFYLIANHIDKREEE